MAPIKGVSDVPRLPRLGKLHLSATPSADQRNL